MLRILQTFQGRSHCSLSIVAFGAALYALFGYLHASVSALGNKKRSSSLTRAFSSVRRTFLPPKHSTQFRRVRIVATLRSPKPTEDGREGRAALAQVGVSRGGWLGVRCDGAWGAGFAVDWSCLSFFARFVRMCLSMLWWWCCVDRSVTKVQYRVSVEGEYSQVADW